jgi:RNA polymerase sigma-70 factor (ECF subfamily)
MAINMMYYQDTLRLEEENQLIEKAKLNPSHFAPLYKKYYESIFRYINKRVDEEEVAYDITSCVFVKALTNLSRYEFRGVPFSSWLFRIAKSELFQAFRDRKAERTVNLDTIHLNQMIDEMEEDASEENRERLFQSLSKLKEEDMQLIEMRFFEKRSFKEIGEILDIT